jgi:uncharacterized protein with FMN-binding domain
MKKVFIVLGAIVLVGVIGTVGFNYKFKQMTEYLNGYTLNNIDLNSVPDGTYNGSCKTFLASVDLSARVKNHRIEDISILKQSSGKGYQGRQVIDRVLKGQSLQVDTKTGATGSSKCILIAVDKALTQTNNN